MEKLEHIGIAVKDLTIANEIFGRLLGKSHYKTEDVESEGVRTSFFQVGDLKIELLQARSEDSPIRKFIDKRGEGLHHIAFQVPDVAKSVKTCQENGFVAINETPRRGADNKLICFLHPKSTGGVLIELCEEINDAVSSH
jgi:methylmalonyl-CoA/ethylmalonyl-CoA epimerase